jgi:hypothetical protein
MAARPKKDAPLPRLTFEQIERADDLERGVVDVPEWGGSVEVRGLTAGEWAKAQEELEGEEADAFLVSCGVVDPPLSQEQAAKLREKSAPAIMAVHGAILRCSKMDLGALEAAERRFFPGAPNNGKPGPA